MLKGIGSRFPPSLWARVAPVPEDTHCRRDERCTMPCIVACVPLVAPANRRAVGPFLVLARPACWVAPRQALTLLVAPKSTPIRDERVFETQRGARPMQVRAIGQIHHIMHKG